MDYREHRNKICRWPTERIIEAIEFEEDMERLEALEDELNARRAAESDPAAIGEQQYREDQADHTDRLPYNYGDCPLPLA